MDHKEIGMKIKHARQTMGLTQKELADQIGTTWEMISRYERGKSSAIKRMDLIAEVLKTPVHKFFMKPSFMDEVATSNKNLIPIISKTFTDIHDALAATKSYYSAPDWIVQQFLDPFAIDTEILTIKTTHIEKVGIIYAIRENPVSETDLVIFTQKEQLVVANNSTITASCNLIATIIAWEKRFY
ncbi:MAG: helix-turn-helix transcriptional regulator [Patescibacteria group bacterium]|nr:helix-turn-helix transcriptional regulator [Patescibacteria group bacterium]